MIRSALMDVMIEHNRIVARIVAPIKLGKPVAHPTVRPMAFFPVERIDIPETELRHFFHQGIVRAIGWPQELFLA